MIARSCVRIGTGFTVRPTGALEITSRRGGPVIDASRYFHKRERLRAGDLCREHRAELLTIFVDTPEHITRERLLANRQSQARRDVSDDDFAAILAAWEPPADDESPLVLRFGEDAIIWIERHSHMLSDR